MSSTYVISHIASLSIDKLTFEILSIVQSFKNDEIFQREFERLNKEIAESKAAQEAE